MGHVLQEQQQRAFFYFSVKIGKADNFNAPEMTLFISLLCITDQHALGSGIYLETEV